MCWRGCHQSESCWRPLFSSEPIACACTLACAYMAIRILLRSGHMSTMLMPQKHYWTIVNMPLSRTWICTCIRTHRMEHPAHWEIAQIQRPPCTALTNQSKPLATASLHPLILSVRDNLIDVMAEAVFSVHDQQSFFDLADAKIGTIDWCESKYLTRVFWRPCKTYYKKERGKYRRTERKDVLIVAILMQYLMTTSERMSDEDGTDLSCWEEGLSYFCWVYWVL